MNNELNFSPNFERLVLGCIDADFCKSILVGKLSPRSAQCTVRKVKLPRRVARTPQASPRGGEQRPAQAAELAAQQLRRCAGPREAMPRSAEVPEGALKKIWGEPRLNRSLLYLA